MPIEPNAPVHVCLLCGGSLKRKSPFYICTECGEKFDPDEVGFSLDTPPNPCRGDQERKQ